MESCDKLVESQYLADSKRCFRITNLMTGVVYERTGEESQRWPILYKRAALEPTCFERSFDKLADELDHIYTEEELKSMDIKRLKEIASVFGSTAKGKLFLIKDILASQAQEVMEKE